MNESPTEKWLNIIKGKMFVQTKYSRIFSKHFLTGDFMIYNK